MSTVYGDAKVETRKPLIKEGGLKDKIKGLFGFAAPWQENDPAAKQLVTDEIRALSLNGGWF